MGVRGMDGKAASREEILRELRAERRRLFVYTITVLVVIAAITVSLYWCLPACSPEERMALLSTRFLFLVASLALAVICLLFSWIRHRERRINAQSLKRQVE